MNYTHHFVSKKLKINIHPAAAKPYLLPRKSYAFTDQNLCF